MVRGKHVKDAFVQLGLLKCANSILFYSIESIHHAGLQVTWLGQYKTARFPPLLSPLLYNSGEHSASGWCDTVLCGTLTKCHYSVTTMSQFSSV